MVDRLSKSEFLGVKIFPEKNVPDTLRQKRQKLNKNHQQKVPKTGEFIGAIG